MGLAGPKNRSRISNDPQNTTWAHNTSRFGHKILTSHGWTPGSSLGATDAAHAAHYTAASASHIRVLLKDDNLGLGAKRGSETAENFGLAGLASILGRLNGNEEAVKKEEEKQEKIDQRAYVYRRYGLMSFVSGGFLVGGEIKPKNEIEVKREIKIKEEIKSESDSSGDDEKKSKKRKRSRDTKEEEEEISAEQPKLKRKKKSMNLREEAENSDGAAQDSSVKSKKSKKDKKQKKERKDKKKSTKSSTSSTDTSISTPIAEPFPSEKARRKAEKRARKEEKKLKKALKRAAKEAAATQPTPTSNNSNDSSSSESENEDETTLTPTASSVPTSGVSTPASGLTFGISARHAARQRYIRQKKMASMDPQALKEILMIKTPS